MLGGDLLQTTSVVEAELGTRSQYLRFQESGGVAHRGFMVGDRPRWECLPAAQISLEHASHAGSQQLLLGFIRHLPNCDQVSPRAGMKRSHGLNPGVLESDQVRKAFFQFDGRPAAGDVLLKHPGDRGVLMKKRHGGEYAQCHEADRDHQYRPEESPPQAIHGNLPTFSSRSRYTF